MCSIWLLTPDGVSYPLPCSIAVLRDVAVVDNGGNLVWQSQSHPHTLHLQDSVHSVLWRFAAVALNRTSFLFQKAHSFEWAFLRIEAAADQGSGEECGLSLYDAHGEWGVVI